MFGTHRSLLSLLLVLAFAAPAWSVCDGTDLTLPACDDFNRGSLGAMWSSPNFNVGTCSDDGANVVSSVGQFVSYCRWNTATFADFPSYSAVKLAAGPNSDGFGLAGACLGMEGGHGVCCGLMNPLDSAQHTSNGTFVDLLGQRVNPTGPGSPAAGDWVAVQRFDETHYQCFLSTDGSTWNPLGEPFVESVSVAAGNPGIAVTRTTGRFLVTDWKADNGFLPAACGTIADGQPCDDGNACTTGETCAFPVCGPGSVVSCDDAEPCTDDSCNQFRVVGDPCNHDAVSDDTPCPGGLCEGGVCFVPTTTTLPFCGEKEGDVCGGPCPEQHICRWRPDRQECACVPKHKDCTVADCEIPSGGLSCKKIDQQCSSSGGFCHCCYVGDHDCHSNADCCSNKCLRGECR